MFASRDVVEEKEKIDYVNRVIYRHHHYDYYYHHHLLI
jgi:hypothetical protein